MSEAHKALLRRWFDEVWNQRRDSAIDEMFAADCVAYGLGASDTPVRGPNEFRQFMSNIVAAFPDVQIRVDDVFADDHRAAARVTLEGTHTGHGLGVAPYRPQSLGSGNRHRTHRERSDRRRLEQLGSVRPPDPDRRTARAAAGGSRYLPRRVAHAIRAPYCAPLLS